MSEINDVLAERGADYGPYAGVADISQAMKRVIRGETLVAKTNWHSLTNAQQEGLEMMVHKMARILNGNPNIKDHWVDIAGYAKRVEETL